MLCNSFPKSGTHLLIQALGALPETEFYGSFIASVPSIRFRLRSDQAHLNRIKSVAPGEVVPSHLYYSPPFADQIRKQRIAHFFIYRDLRDVVVSEAFYLHSMAWWHGLSRHFRACPNLESRLLLSINGMPDKLPNEYPGVGSRFRFYQPWIDDPNCMAIRFEDLVSDEKREETLRGIATFDQSIRGRAYDVNDFVSKATVAMNPGKSHTFRSGKRQEWKKHFTPAIEKAFDRVAGEVNSSLGYQ
ncbi:sulfotransferase domain-containing protein [Rhodopirellula halodulae]|uniref:sulfotransferase domain-containing protein n=1 Tax=Rhodopirellula halodulae TaxID=2894198 RepID=UPI001E5288E6|nr:sulfotransferase domain-containing protein [Rhodopirellula sp. JC737]MCC9654435.1 sulfotransferase domain-containing protein [Rhodopirellula sp. JC737]